MITPSFALTATERVLPKLALDFTTASLDSRVTFTRSGNTATVVNSSGVIQTINANLPRFDYELNTGGTCKGLLIEETRTNILPLSNKFDVSYWSRQTPIVVTENAGTAPDGTSTANNIAGATGTVFNSATLRASVTSLTAGATYTFSVYLKLTSSTKATIYVRDGSTGGVGSTNAVSTSEWQRVVVTRTLGAGTTGVAFFIGNTDGDILGWGIQCELGAFATSYIPTGASVVTRNADVATMTGANFSDWYSAGAGGVVARVLPSTVSGTRPALQFDDATANEVITLRGSTTNPELVIVDGGSPQAQIDAGTIAANTAYNLGAAWNTDNCAAAVNGGAAVTDTTATIPTVTQARLGSDGTNYLNGHLQTLRYWPQRIINAEVQAFSK
jgi:hypothetical protein